MNGTAAAPDRVWTVLELLRWTTEHFRARGIETPRLDAECLLAHALGTDRLRLYLEFDKPVVERERAAFRSLVRARAGERVPVALLTGQREFWSLPLRVSPDVLIPRPDTETLVAAALDLLPDHGAPARVLDLGTGSGAVALAIAKERPRAVVLATDRSRDALRIAQQNAETLGMAARIHFLRGDWAAAIAGGFDCVVANPPYLAESERAALAPELAHEPVVALFAGPTGLEALEQLCRDVPALLAPCGGLAFELAPGQAGQVQLWLSGAGLATAVHRDLAGRARVVSGRAGVRRNPRRSVMFQADGGG
ncbi:MAG: peptide chain release factor N(5)-glutamine methyltransferase [Deltaproteobacteria bacterium]|nr:MAG: peptide chain release factor N(5)-glutamine methyltransferase [Deltaproteobacteria bacterium]